MTTLIKTQDFIDSIYEAIQFISYYHPRDFLQAMKHAYDIEENPSAKAAIAQILVNSKMCAIGHRPLCQDTGAVTCFVKIGMDVRFEGDMTVQEMVDEGTDILNQHRAQIAHEAVGQVVVRTVASAKNQGFPVEHPALRVVGKVHGHAVRSALVVRVAQEFAAHGDEFAFVVCRAR